MVIKWGIWYNLSDRVILYINMPNTKHIYNMIELIDKEKIRGRKMSDIKVSIIMPYINRRIRRKSNRKYTGANFNRMGIHYSG